MTTDILDLPNWRVLNKRLIEHEYELEAEFLLQPSACQKCGSIGHLYRHGTKESIFRDSPIRGHPVRILARVQRYRCRDCGETFLQPLDGIQDARRMTERCATFIEAQCLRDTFVRIAEHVGCDDKTVRNLAGGYIARLEAAYKPWLPAWLGIDETKIDGKMRCVLTDIDARRPVEMLADRDKKTVTTWLHKFKERQHVRGVAIDMWRPYLDVSRTLFPHVPVVIDKFHVIRMANYSMERTRIRLAKVRGPKVRLEWMRSKAILNKRTTKLTEKQRFNLDMWLDNEPELADAYRLKEAFYAIYDLPKAQALPAFDSFAADVPAALKPDFKVLLTAMKNWRTQIVSYFDHPISNAYTEALNGVAKTINRAGRGYSFEVLRARLIFGSQSATGPQSEVVEAPIAAQNTLRAHLLKASNGRCESCMGVFQPRSLEVHLAPAVVPGEHRKGMLVCKDCHARFHTSGLTHSAGPSTQ
jgi:transposase